MKNPHPSAFLESHRLSTGVHITGLHIEIQPATASALHRRGLLELNGKPSEHRDAAKKYGDFTGFENHHQITILDFTGILLGFEWDFEWGLWWDFDGIYNHNAYFLAPWW